MVTAQEDKDCFDLILQKVVGDKVESTVIANVYREIDRIVQKMMKVKKIRLRC